MKDKSKVLKTYGYMFRKFAIRQINRNFYGNTLNS